MQKLLVRSAVTYAAVNELAELKRQTVHTFLVSKYHNVMLLWKKVVGSTT